MKKSGSGPKKLNFPTAILNNDYESYKNTIVESVTILFDLIFNMSMESPNNVSYGSLGTYYI
jgi:hypothetical protein